MSDQSRESIEKVMELVTADEVSDDELQEAIAQLPGATTVDRARLFNSILGIQRSIDAVPTYSFVSRYTASWLAGEDSSPSEQTIQKMVLQVFGWEWETHLSEPEQNHLLARVSDVWAAAQTVRLSEDLIVERAILKDLAMEEILREQSHTDEQTSRQTMTEAVSARFETANAAGKTTLSEKEFSLSFAANLPLQKSMIHRGDLDRFQNLQAYSEAARHQKHLRYLRQQERQCRLQFGIPFLYDGDSTRVAFWYSQNVQKTELELAAHQLEFSDTQSLAAPTKSELNAFIDYVS